MTTAKPATIVCRVAPVDSPEGLWFKLVAPIARFHENQDDYKALHNMPMGRTRGHIIDSVREINERRAPLGLPLIEVKF